MKLSKLYCDKAEMFNPITFNESLNVIVIKTISTENENKETYYLDRSIIGRIIDFCLLNNNKESILLIKSEEILGEAIFFLEIEISPTLFITIKRSISDPTKISFLFSSAKVENASVLKQKEWDFVDITLERAREVLWKKLRWRWLYLSQAMRLLTYFVRSPFDHEFPFRPLIDYPRHHDLKLLVAELTGVSDHLLAKGYELQKKYDSLTAEYKKLPIDPRYGDNISKVSGLKNALEEELPRLENFVNVMNFSELDEEKAEKASRKPSRKISILLKKINKVDLNLDIIKNHLKTEKSLLDKNTDKITITAVGSIPSEELQKLLEDPIKFGNSPAPERISYLEREEEKFIKERENLKEELKIILDQQGENLDLLNQCQEMWQVPQAKLQIKLKKDVLSKLSTAIGYIKERVQKKSELLKAQDRLEDIKTKILEEVMRLSANNSYFSEVNLKFAKMNEKVLGTKALIYLSTAELEEGDVKLKAEPITPDGVTTYEPKDEAFKKIFCVTYDLSFLISRMEMPFPRFVFHDEPFKGLEERKQENLKNIIEAACEEGVQYVMTVSESDLPLLSFSKPFEDKDIVAKVQVEKKVIN